MAAVFTGALPGAALLGAAFAALPGVGATAAPMPFPVGFTAVGFTAVGFTAVGFAAVAFAAVGFAAVGFTAVAFAAASATRAPFAAEAGAFRAAPATLSGAFVFFGADALFAAACTVLERPFFAEEASAEIGAEPLAFFDAVMIGAPPFEVFMGAFVFPRAGATIVAFRPDVGALCLAFGFGAFAGAPF